MALQEKTEASVEKCFDRFDELFLTQPRLSQIFRLEHQYYLDAMLRRLPTNYECLDSSRAWCVFWILQAAQLLSFTFDDQTLDQVVQFLSKWVAYGNTNP